MGLILIVVVIVIAFVLIDQARGGSGIFNCGQTATKTAETPLDILRKRYARGEIDKAEFDERCRGLS